MREPLYGSRDAPTTASPARRTPVPPERVVRPNLTRRDARTRDAARSGVQALLAERASSGLSPRTVRSILRVLGRALTVAVRQGVIGRNVATLIDGPRVTRYEITPMAVRKQN